MTEPVETASVEDAQRPQATPESIEKAQQFILSEKNVRDLLYEPGQAVQWKIALDDDGTDRLGLATYFCLRLEEHGVPRDDQRIRLISWQRIKQDRMYDDDANLATVDCASGQRFGAARD